MKDWQQTTLGALADAKGCTIQTGPFGSQLHKHEYQDDGVGVVNPTHMAERRVTHTNVPRVSAEIAERLSKHKLRPGDLLFARRGEIGRHAVITEAERGWLCGTGCFLVRIDSPKGDPTFLSFFLSTDESVDWLERHAAGVVMPNLSNQVLKRVPVSVPPLPEQKKIAHILSTVQRAIEAQERIIQTTTELKKALMHKLFTEGLRNEPPKQTEIGPIPESWKVVRFEDSVSIKNGQVDPRESPFGDMLHVGSENIESDTGRLVKLQTNAELKISSGNYHFTSEDVLYSKIRPYLNKVALPEFQGTCSADMYPLRSSSHFKREFLFYYLLSDGFKKAAISFQDRTGIPKINRVQLGSIRLACPSKEEQIEIANTLASCDGKRDIAQRKRETLQGLFRTLLHELMTANTRVNEMEIPA